MPSPTGPAAMKIETRGNYGNCVFSTTDIGRQGENALPPGSVFAAGDPLFARCWFVKPVGRNKAGEIWEELWIDGVKRAQILYDPALPEQQDQISLEVSSRHGARLSALSGGKHTLDVWIYRQPDGAQNPEPLAAGELVVRK